MKFTLNVRTIWEFGQRVDSSGKPHQEDSLYPEHGGASSDDRLFIVCDGMGGHEAGEVASAAVCQSMAAAIDVPGVDSEGPFHDSALRKALAAAYDSLDCIPGHERRKPGTTLALLKLHAAGATIAHIGDSRVYHIRPGEDAASTRILFETSDHSLVNELVKLGELTPEQARVSPQRNVITRAMQPRLNPRPEAEVDYVTDIRPGDYFYICSDGMLEQADDASLRALFAENKTIDEKVDALIKDTAGNQDNHTAILVEVTGVEGEARPVTSCVSPQEALAAARAQAALNESANGQTSHGTAAEDAHDRIATPVSRSTSASENAGGHSKMGWIALIVIVAIVAAAAVWIFAFPHKATEVTKADTVILQQETVMMAEEPYPSTEPNFASDPASAQSPGIHPQQAERPAAQQPAPKEPALSTKDATTNPQEEKNADSDNRNDNNKKPRNNLESKPQPNTRPTPEGTPI